MNNKVLIPVIVSVVLLVIGAFLAVLFLVILDNTESDLCGDDGNCDIIDPEDWILISKNSSLTYPAVITLEKYSQENCQVRLDFIQFKVGEPLDNGTCFNGGMVIGGHDNTNRVPLIICGENEGQHIYLNFIEFTPILITIVSLYDDDYWSIMAKYIKCDDEEMIAPKDCLQYFPEPNGIVSSFNFVDITKVANPPKLYQLLNLNYLVCIGSSSDNFDRITWTKGNDTTDYYFVLTGNIETIPKSIVGTLEAAEFDPECSTTSKSLDYVEIERGRYINVNGTMEWKDQFCGAGFPESVVSTVKPFRLRVVTNEYEEDREGSVGFSLSYALS